MPRLGPRGDGGPRIAGGCRGNFTLRPAPFSPKLKNFSRKSHYELVSRAFQRSWCRNPELDFGGLLHFCFVDVLHNCNGAVWRIRFQESEINSFKLISTANQSKNTKFKIKNQKIQEIQKNALHKIRRRYPANQSANPRTTTSAAPVMPL